MKRGINMENCLFCKIISGEINTEFLYEDENVVAFKDIAPQAPIHALVIPKTHIKSFRDIDESNIKLFSSLNKAIKKIVGDADYRLVTNDGPTAGQTLFHLHFHVLSGRDMTWPPG